MTIEEAIDNYIHDELLHGRNVQIDPDKSLISSGLLDSLTLLQLIAYLEEKFNISVDDSEMNSGNFQTIRIMTAFVEKKMKGSK